MKRKSTAIAAVWMLLPGEPDDAELAKLQSLLFDEDERAAYGRLRLAHNRAEYMAGRLLVKNRLALSLDRRPREIRLARTSSGKPYARLDPARAKAMGLYFNLTHAEGLAACAFGAQPDIGIDAARCGSEHLALTDTLFLPAEAAYIAEGRDALSSADRFGMLWTRKEAAMKACGLGLTLHPQRCPVPTAAGIAGDGRFHWHTARAGEGHWLSVAVGCEADADPVVRIERTSWAEEIERLRRF